MPTADETLAMTKEALNSVFSEVRHLGDEELIESIAQDVVKTTVKLAAATNARQREIHTQTIRSLYSRAANIAARRYLKAAEAGETAFFGIMEALVSLLVKAAIR